METTDVIICGCGPTGALLSGLLGQLNVQNIVLEREKEVVTDPRGIALDEDGIRILQEIGLYDKIYGEIAQPIEWAYFISGKNGLLTRPFLGMHAGTSEGGTGHIGVIAHKQPLMEKYLRLAASGCPSSQLRLGSTVVNIEEDSQWIYAKYAGDNGTERRIRGKFLVGADGKTGFIRKHYLEPKGVLLEMVPGYEYQETWVAMNWHMDLPTRETHPDFPLWKLNYTPQQVFDAFFPSDFRFIGNPDRPAVCGTFGPRSERLWRFEFVVDRSEDPQEMSTWEKTSAVVLPYLIHRGSQYGQVGGQGIASGFRDASGVAWRLAIACRPGSDGSYEDIFNGWFLERKQQLDRSLASTVANGNLTTARNPLKIFLRDWSLWMMQLIPAWRHQLELGPRALGMVRYKYTKGMAFLPDMAGGGCLPQVYCRAVCHSTSGKSRAVQFTDDVLLNGSRTNALLRLLVVVENMKEVEESWAELKGINLEEASNGEVQASSAMFLIHSLENQQSMPHPDLPLENLYQVATADEFAASDACKNRPYPTGYDMHRIRKDLQEKRYVLVRPDRFVYAACNTGGELLAACERISTTLLGSSRSKKPQGSSKL
ncbi:hypothetical protein H2200_011970 [Cladophialophora chaetospira]|uniref:FAD-binding domain-containing protein n=1 Tax=Cladophialophora chaetospira TaxID=386627 RepID=A0AA39CD09_9EURO|nr:hypothetical protein H2200_011970 [Cladophialophora chaetospira]